MLLFELLFGSVVFFREVEVLFLLLLKRELKLIQLSASSGYFVLSSLDAFFVFPLCIGPFFRQRVEALLNCADFFVYTLVIAILGFQVRKLLFQFGDEFFLFLSSQLYTARICR